MIFGSALPADIITSVLYHAVTSFSSRYGYFFLDIFIALFAHTVYTYIMLMLRLEKYHEMDDSIGYTRLGEILSAAA